MISQILYKNGTVEDLKELQVNHEFGFTEITVMLPDESLVLVSLTDKDIIKLLDEKLILYLKEI